MNTEHDKLNLFDLPLFYQKVREYYQYFIKGRSDNLGTNMLMYWVLNEMNHPLVSKFVSIPACNNLTRRTWNQVVAKEYVEEVIQQVEIIKQEVLGS